MRRSLREKLKLILAFIGFLWVVFLVDVVIPVPLASFGLKPRSAVGLIGVVTMPLLHGGFHHILSNTIPLSVLLFLLSGSRMRSAEVVVGLIILGGFLLWLTGPSGATHVGASGLVYGLITFLIVAGMRQRRFLSLAVAVVTGFLFGGTLVFGILSSVGEGISWQGHLTGAAAGVIIAMYTEKRSTRFRFRRAVARKS